MYIKMFGIRRADVDKNAFAAYNYKKTKRDKL